MSEPTAETASLTRNAVDSLPAGELERKLARATSEGRSLRVKLGIDPTAPDIHLGHVVVLQKLREFQDAGHTIVLIIGDYTARVGDPSGLSETRPVVPPEQIDANAVTFQEQAFKVLERERTEVRRNGEWLDMAMEDLFRLARTVTVARVLERADFQDRLERGQSISLLELLYPVMQGYDSVAVEADLELGGTDQKFNLLLGRDIQHAYGQEPQCILTMPILPGTDGQRKMSKSLGNQIGVTDPPAEIFGRTMRVPDDAMDAYYELLLGEPPPGGHPGEAKRALARRLVARFYDAEAAEAAEARFDRLHREHAAPDDVEEAQLGMEEVTDGTVHLPAVIAAHFGGSRGSARHVLDQGGVRIDGEAVPAGEYDAPAERLDGALLQVGKRHFRRLRMPA